MDLSSENIVLTLSEQLIKWREKQIMPSDKVKFHWSDLHLSIVVDYFSKFSIICDFRELPSAKLFNERLQAASFPQKFQEFCKVLRLAMPETSTICPKLAASFMQELQEFFKVPRLGKLYEGDNSIKKYQLVEAFISFLVRLLYHKTESIDPWKDRIDNLEKELRFLLTILGDTSLMLCDDEHEEFQKLLAEFEAVANEAGSLIHSLFFSMDRAFVKMDEGLGAVLSHIDLLKANIMKFLNLLSSISRPAHITPKSSVVDSLLIVDSLIYDLEDLMNREDNPIADVNDQIKMLNKELTVLQYSIKDIGAPQPSEIRELKEPLMRIGDLAHEAEYLIISFVVGDAPLWYLNTRLTDINHKIEFIVAKLQEITKKYKFGDLKVPKYFKAQLSLQAKRNTEVDDVTVGFEDKVTDVLHQLLGGTKRLQVISIIGMPGLGKTTLAKKLYDHPSVNHWFDKLSWCVVSQTYQRQSILAKVLSHIKSEKDKDWILKMEEESLVEHIYKTLKGRRFLIVMDDIWDSNVWDDLQRCFPDEGNGSRILFTSRNKDVAPPNNIIYALPSLSNNQCWELLEKKVFHNKSCPPELLGTGKKIASNCYGLPLTVVVIAGILSTMDKEISTWEEVGGNLASYIFDGGDNSVMQILELSYKHLPEHLKPCFLYFGAFEEDKEIPVRKLMRLWISEGFVRKEEEKSAENVAEEYLMELIDKSLIMVAKRRSDGGVKACVIHDLLHDLCLKRSEEENFLNFVKSNDYSIYEKGHRLQVLRYPSASIYCQHVRSFCGRDLISPFYVRNMRLLRVLHSDCIDTHYIGIEFLVYLRYLVINDMPASIGSLVNLEYLRVETFATVYLPPTIVKMRKLRYIHVGSEAIYGRHCNSSQTNNLEFLSGIIMRELNDEQMLRCSPYLRKLKCTYDQLLRGERSSYRHFDLSFLTQLESLNLRFYMIGMDRISLPSNIKTLTLSGFVLSCENLSVIGRMENLEVLKLSTEFEGERWDTRDGEFQNLKFLKFDSILLIQWNVASSDHFPKLQRVVFSDCRFLREIPFEIGEIATLQLIEVKERCPKSMVESAKKIQQEQWDMGNEELRVIIPK